MEDGTKHRILTRFILAAMVCLAEPSSASTIYCVDSRLSNDEWVKKHFELSEFVVLAEVTDSRTVPRPHPPATDPVGSMKELLELIEDGQKQQTSSHEAVLLIAKVWKGSNEPRLRVFYDASPGQYGFTLPIGKRFLIFGSLLTDGRYSISTICEMAVPEREAGAKISALEKLVSK